MNLILKSIELHNFKCFEKHTVFFNECTVMIGKNNAGKTTVVEALRIIGVSLAKLKTTKIYNKRPEWLRGFLGLAAKGTKISSNNIDIDLEQVFYRYGNPPALLIANFSENVSLRIYIGSETEIYATLWEADNNIQFNRLSMHKNIPDICVLPQIVPLLKEESYVTEETLQKNIYSKRISGNFRNHILKIYRTPVYEEFQRLINDTWGSILVDSVEKSSDLRRVTLNIRDGSFVSEIYHLGHGLQMWLQTLWFIVTVPSNAIIVLDEPDVYMHADLQRKLIRLIKTLFNQSIVATHSLEIMSEVHAESILIIDRTNHISALAKDYPIIQATLNNMGSIHNVMLMRIINNKKYIFVEGYDINLLRIFYDKIFPNDKIPLDHIPYTSTGGWGSWSIQKNIADQMLSTMSELKLYYIYDRDYHSDREIEERMKEAHDRKVVMHIWERKEIENYLISSNVVAKFVCKQRQELNFSDVVKDIELTLCEILKNLKENVLVSIMETLSQQKEYKGKTTKCYKVATSIISEVWENEERILGIVPGKEVIKRLSDECKKNFNVSFNSVQLASVMDASDIHPEIKRLLSLIRK